jgi:hypothetical protein
MKTWKVTIKEVGREKPIETYHSGNRTYSEVKEFFGCNESDVEWYKIEEVER